MSIKAITAGEISSAQKQDQNKSANRNRQRHAHPSFQGLSDVPVAVANAINNGGFAFSFIAQDGCGMAIPRVLEGINRRQVNPETGKKEGPYNWAFARREGIREILSGPSAFIIPSIILYFVKKYSGQANNVPVEMIQGLGKNFIDYAATPGVNLKDIAKTRKDFYRNVFRNVLNTTFDGKLPAETLDAKAQDYMERAIEIEGAKDHKKPLWKKVANIKVEGSPEDLTESLLDDFMALKKKYLPASVNEMTAELTVNPEKFDKYGEALTEGDKTGVSFKKLLKTMTDFTDDVIETTGAAMKKVKEGFDPKEFLDSFIKRRTGSRIITNVGMWLAVVGFYTLIPKLYSLGLHGKNPAFAHEQKTNETGSKAESSAQTSKKEVSFSGKEQIFSNASDKILSSSKLKNFFSHFEFDDASMSVNSMLALLFGFCLPTRLLNAPDKYDVRETLTRDVTSFGAILFAAHAISRGFSNVFSKISGLALNVKPANHNESYWNKFKNYFSPGGGINVLDNKQLASKYTNVHAYKDGINGFFDFITENGGNLKKMLKMDETVAENVKIILGKDLKDAKDDNEIKEAFKNITSDEAQKAKTVIENVFKDSKNKFVKSAKFYNSTFTFLSTIAIVPAFMVWLARKCDKMTREARAKDMALASKQNSSAATTAQKTRETAKIPTARPTMEGFLRG